MCGGLISCSPVVQHPLVRRRRQALRRLYISHWQEWDEVWRGSVPVRK